MTVGIIDTATANIASVRFALERLNIGYASARDPGEAAGCDRLILPGVGAAGSAMRTLGARGWVEALRTETRPVLGLCLGMQLLFEHSEESGCDLLGLIPGQVVKLDPGAERPWPHMGWNALDYRAEDEPLLGGVEADDRVYFVHGFHVPPGRHARATTHYGAAVTAVARKDNVAGCQFHPERSGEVGARILRNFVESSE